LQENRPNNKHPRQKLKQLIIKLPLPWVEEPKIINLPLTPFASIFLVFTLFEYLQKNYNEWSKEKVEKDMVEEVFEENSKIETRFIEFIFYNRFLLLFSLLQ